MLPCFALLCFTPFRKGSQAPVFIWWWDLFRVSPFFLTLPQHFLTLWLSFFLGWDTREFVWVFFCLIVGFCESWDHQTFTESCSPIQLCFITYTRSYWNPIPLEVHSSFPLHLGAFFVTQTRAFVEEVSPRPLQALDTPCELPPVRLSPLSRSHW